jgi:hypothetical protein
MIDTTLRGSGGHASHGFNPNNTLQCAVKNGPLKKPWANST